MTSTPTRDKNGAAVVTPDGEEKSSKNAQIANPNEHDVLCGRGGSINAHPGNERFRELVERRKRVYLTARFKREKRLIASSIVSEIRMLDPPGRFLSKDSKTGCWFDIGDEKARDKTSQALRENAPSIRAEIETEINEQRAEIQRVETEQHHQHPQQHPVHPVPPPPNGGPEGTHPPPPGYFGAPGWGYYSYYGYAQHAAPHTSMPPPPPVPPGGRPGLPPPPPPPPPHGQQYPHPHAPPPPPPPPPHYNGGPWAAGAPQPSQPPPQPTQSSPTASTPQPSSQQQQQQQQQQQLQQQQQQQQRTPPTGAEYPVPDQQKSAFEQTADMVNSVSSVPQSFANWTKASFSFHSTQEDQDGHEEATVCSVQSKPIVYIHRPEEDEASRNSGGTTNGGNQRRVVHFRDDPRTRPNAARRRTLPPRSGASVMRTSSIQINPNRYPKKKKIKSSLQQQQQQQHRQYNNFNECSDPRGRMLHSPINHVDYSNNANDAMSSIGDGGMSSIVEEDPIMSFVDEDAPLEDEGESTPDGIPPEEMDDQSQRGPSSVLSQMANSISGSIFGSSWDGGNMYEGSVIGSVGSLFGGQSSVGGGSQIQRQGGTTGKRRGSLSSLASFGTFGTFGTSQAGGNSVCDQSTSAVSRDNTMAVEIEGQEVKLYDIMDQDAKSIIADVERRNPPHSQHPNNHRHAKQKFEIDWPSRVGSCHSWIPDTLGAASFFSKGSNVSPVGSMEMESCGGSIAGGSIGGGSIGGGSIGGGSLCKVFDQTDGGSQFHNNQLPPPRSSVGGGASANNPMIKQMPSWERSFRSKSPLSIQSDDDESLISKSSDKFGSTSSHDPFHTPIRDDDTSMNIG